jgi:putative FmdB family regulatory protein
MPTYEYLCQTCRHRFETWQKMTDEPLTVCPECHGEIRRVLFPAGIVFKGSGFYKTDSAKTDTATSPVSSESKSSSSSSESSTPASSETASTGTTA